MYLIQQDGKGKLAQSRDKSSSYLNQKNHIQDIKINCINRILQKVQTSSTYFIFECIGVYL